MFQRLRPGKFITALLTVLIFLVPHTVVNAAATPQVGDLNISTSIMGDITGMLAYYSFPDTLKPIVNGTVTISANVTDATSVKISRSGSVSEEFPASNLGPNLYGFSFDASSYSEGESHFVFSATNEEGAEDHKSLTVIVDKTAPTVNYGAGTPTNMEVISGNLEIGGDFADNYGLSGIFITLGLDLACVIGPSSDFATDTPANGYHSCLFDTTELEDGVYPVILVAVDKAGNTSEVHSVSIEVDNEEEPIDTTAPVFVSKDVTRDEGESLPSISEFVLSNPENLEVTCNLPLQSELVVNQPNLNKLIPVTCSVTDAAGNTTTSTSNLIVNNVQPQVVLIADPSTSVSENGLVTMYANILRGNSLFTYNWTGACSGSGSTTLLGLLPSQTVGRTQGSYICGIVVTDADGDTSAASVLLNFTTASNNAVAGSNNSNSNSTADTTDTTVDENSDSNTEDETTDEEEGQVEGVSTENTVSGPNSDTNVVPATNATSPLVVICLVAGGILIIGLLLFLFFRGEDEEETQSASAS